MNSNLSTTKTMNANYKSIQKTAALKAFLREANRYGNPSKEELAELTDRIQAGDRDAVHQMACMHMRWLYRIVVDKFVVGDGSPVCIDDLLQEGMYSLLKAAETYDASRGAFTNYSKFVITNDLYRVTNESRVFGRMPEGAYADKKAIDKAVERFHADYCCMADPSDDYLSEATGLRLERVKALRSFDAVGQSTSDAYVNHLTNECCYKDKAEGVKLELGDVLPSLGFEPGFDGRKFCAALDIALEGVKQRDVEVFRHYHGLTEEKLRVSDIAAQYGMSEVNVRLISKRILGMLHRDPIMRSFIG